MANKRHDHKHPKLASVVNEVLKHWKGGEKVLVFCFRVNTAERLREIISDKIREELEVGKKKCLGGEGQLKTLRARLTGCDRDLVVLGLDRVLWSLAWAQGKQFPIPPDQFILSDTELTELARLSLIYAVDVIGECVDRVFLNRATEHVLAKRFMKSDIIDPKVSRVFKQMSTLDWIAVPYGLQYRGEQEEQSVDESSFDERGCHTKYSVTDHEPSSYEISELEKTLRSTRQRAHIQKQIPVLDFYALAPSLSLGAEPQLLWKDPLAASLQKPFRQSTNTYGSSPNQGNSTRC